MLVDGPLGLAPSAMVRFRAIWPGGWVDRHELPVATAIAFAEQLRELGVLVAWYPFAPPPPEPVAQAPRRERKAAKRERARQFSELGVPA